MKSQTQSGHWFVPGTGATIRHSELMHDLCKKSAVLLGETYDSYEVHRWQLHVLAGLHALRDDIVVGFEMFPRSVQPALDRWAKGLTNVETFLEEAKWSDVWRFNPALYLPIFQFCRQFYLPMIALNCRWSLVTEVGKMGWDAIAMEDTEGLTPSVPATSEYRKYLFDITGDTRTVREAQGPEDPAFDRFVRAQQTWDRSFACGISDARKKFGRPLVVGIIARGHLEYGYGTPYQLYDLGMTDVAVVLTQQMSNRTFSARTADAVFTESDLGT